LAEIGELPGVLAYGASEAEATARAQALALRVIADRLEHGEQDPSLQNLTFAAA
jgi:predicted RNase H-like HicB family nuclease